MRACHYQDRPGKRSLCLRTMVQGRALSEIDWRPCADSDECPFRSWEVERRQLVTAVRSEILGGCPSCGRRHDTVGEHLHCLMEGRLQRVLEEMGPPKGSTSPLLKKMFPRYMIGMARRKIRSAVIDRDGHTCTQCGRDLNKYPKWYTEVHHVIPVVEGGSDVPENLVTLCMECHGRHTDELNKRIFGHGRDGKGTSNRRRRIIQTSLDDDLWI
ncbi:MAG: HNH endonuclease [Methanomassiliicoccales archaeon]|nr:MAG: HNH endonuclease [Methanomassiliicoccales archaeon]